MQLVIALSFLTLQPPSACPHYPMIPEELTFAVNLAQRSPSWAPWELIQPSEDEWLLRD